MTNMLHNLNLIIHIIRKDKYNTINLSKRKISQVSYYVYIFNSNIYFFSKSKFNVCHLFTGSDIWFVFLWYLIHRFLLLSAQYLVSDLWIWSTQDYEDIPLFALTCLTHYSIVFPSLEPKIHKLLLLYNRSATE